MKSLIAALLIFSCLLGCAGIPDSIDHGWAVGYKRKEKMYDSKDTVSIDYTSLSKTIKVFGVKIVPKLSYGIGNKDGYEEIVGEIGLKW